MALKKCPYCGEPIEDDNYCFACGTPLKHYQRDKDKDDSSILDTGRKSRGKDCFEHKECFEGPKECFEERFSFNIPKRPRQPRELGLYHTPFGPSKVRGESVFFSVKTGSLTFIITFISLLFAFWITNTIFSFILGFGGMFFASSGLAEDLLANSEIIGNFIATTPKEALIEKLSPVIVIGVIIYLVIYKKIYSFFKHAFTPVNIYGVTANYIFTAKGKKVCDVINKRDVRRIEATAQSVEVHYIDKNVTRKLSIRNLGDIDPEELKTKLL